MADSSRVIVKGLPKHATTDQLRKHFSAFSEVTDARVMFTPEGQSRRFGFVGYRSPAMAQKARDHFNRTFMDTSRLIVEIAQPVGSKELPRPWSRHSEGSSAYERRHPKEDKADSGVVAKVDKPTKTTEDTESDSKLEEFLGLMGRGGSKGKFWANDSAELKGTAQVQRVPNRKPGGEGTTVERMHVTFEESDSDEEEYQDISQDNPNTGGDGPTGAEIAEGVAENASESESESGNKSKSRSGSGSESGSESDAAITPHVSDGDTLSAQRAETGRLFVRNLPFSVEESDLADLFKQHGRVTEIHVAVDKSTQRGKGFAYVQMGSATEANIALTAIDMTIFQGRLVHVLHADQKSIANELGKTPQQEIKERKKAESMQERAWNSLFMRQDTVVTATANKIGASKADLLLGDGEESAAVRVALAETSLIHDTKAMLEREGVSIEALDPSIKTPRKRSDRTILVKNLPPTTELEDLELLFHPVGAVERLVLPPTRTLAIVEYTRPADAKSAFRRFSFKSFKHVPLYLEWAPVGLFKAPAPKQDTSGLEEKTEVTATTPAADRTLFLKNIASSATEGMIKQALEGQHFRVAAVTLPRKRVLTSGTKSATQGSHMGYGFVEFVTAEEAERALRACQSVEIAGQLVTLQRSESKGHAADSPPTSGSGKRFAEDKGTSTKLMVRNIPFEATKTEVQQLFASLAQVKSVRLPRKFGGGHRGFGFIEFATKKQAAQAMEALRSTHLYGRHLVIEYAAEEQDVEALRERVTQHYSAAPVTKRQKISQEEDEETGFIPL